MSNQVIESSKQLDHIERYYTEAAMMQFGGSFVSKLGATMRSADPHNFNRLIEAFPECINLYGPNSCFYKSVKLEQENEYI
jgi:hypothetical protein